MTGIDDHGLGDWRGKEKGKTSKSYTSAFFFFFNFLNNLINTQVLKIAWSFISMAFLGYLILFASSLTSLWPWHCYLGYRMMLVK